MLIGIDIPTPEIAVCFFKECRKFIIFDCPGWGLMFDDGLGQMYFHNECMNIYEGVPIA